MPKPTLDESFAQDLPSRRPDQRHSWLTAGERRFILWGLKERWPATRIAVQLGVNEATVRKFRQNYLQDPALVLELGLYEMAGSSLMMSSSAWYAKTGFRPVRRRNATYYDTS